MNATAAALADESLPIDCAVNFALLLTRARRVVQFDLKWVTESERAAANRLMEMHADLIAWQADAAGNLAVFRKEDESALRSEIEASGGMRSLGYARLLDPDFYCCAHDLLGGKDHVYKQEQLSQVIVNVIQNRTRIGPILAQMLTADELAINLGRLYMRYRAVSRMVAAVDPALQTTFTVYSKPGEWDASPTYAIATLKDA